jgi:bacterioferritin
MENNNTYVTLLSLLNSAIAREMQVSIQYMLQHAIGSARTAQTAAKQERFVATHSPVWLPGSSLKKIAITEMRHAEAIAERIVQLGGEPTTKPSPITIGKTPKEILEIDKSVEEGAIQLYKQIIDVSVKTGDETTKKLFIKILSDEEEHLKQFSSYLEKE